MTPEPPPAGPAGSADDAARRRELADGLAGVHRRIAGAAAQAGRDPAGITLVVVTKTHPCADLRRLAAIGVRDIGEAREQEAWAKYTELAGTPQAAGLVWHFVGRLQRNKARRLARYADLVHSVDREDLLAPLGRGAVASGRQVGVLVQLSLDGDPARGGVSVVDGPDRMLRLADAVAATEGLSLRGVMTVGPLGADPRQAFSVLGPLSRRLLRDHPGAAVISAGMSGDLEQAVAAGATHLRVGTAILGARPPLG